MSATSLVSPPIGRRSPRRLAVLAVGIALIAVALAQMLTGLARPAPTHSVFAGPGPYRFGDQHIVLKERPSTEPARVFVDVHIGEQIMTGAEPVWFDATAPANDYARRYDGRFRFATPREDGDFVVVEIEPQHSNARRVAYRVWRVDADGVSERRVEAAAAAGRKTLVTALTGLPPRSVSAWPPLSGLLGGVLLTVLGAARRYPPGGSALALVCIVASAALAGLWPLLEYAGLARTLPGVVLGLGGTLLAAALIGPKLRARVSGVKPGRALLMGAAFGALLFGVFVALDVGVGALVAPVFHAPGGANPMGMFVRDYVAPTASLLSVGLVPAALIGSGFAALLRVPQAAA